MTATLQEVTMGIYLRGKCKRKSKDRKAYTMTTQREELPVHDNAFILSIDAA
jgi:hypothetical protein